MDKTILNGSKLRVYDQGNSQSGSIQYTQSRLKITGNNSGSGVLISDGKLYLKSGATTTSIIYDSTTTGVTITDGILHLKSGNSTTSMTYVSSSNPGVSFNSGRIYLGTGSNVSLYALEDNLLVVPSAVFFDNSAEFNASVEVQQVLTVYERIIAGTGFTSSGYLKIGGNSTLSNVRVNKGDIYINDGVYYQTVNDELSEIFTIMDNANGTKAFTIDTLNKHIVFNESGQQYKVSIGHDSPDQTLDVDGSLKVSGNSTLSNVLASDITVSNLSIPNGNYYQSNDNSDGKIFHIFDSDSPTECYIDPSIYRLILDSQGQYLIGVGTDVPTKYFDVAGTAKIRNDLFVDTNILVTNSITSTPFVPGFAGSGFAITKDNNRYIAQFDDLWVRGSMNVYQMVINQIRATNGSLWVSDAGKATYATYSSTANSIGLKFQTGSLLPFVAGDILRSKRWGTSGSTTQSVWDVVTTVSAVNYAAGTLTISAPTINNLYTVTGSANGTWTQLAERLSNSGSQWVRVGNIGSNLDRRGSIYITSTDLGGPFLDVYDLVTSSVQATGGISGSVRQSKTKVRLGQLSGIVDSNFGGALSGYGLYADNVYLRGTISATAGNLGGWQINSDHIYKSLDTYDYQQQDGYIKIGARLDGGFGYQVFIWDSRANLGVDDNGHPEFILHNTILDQYFKYQNSRIQIKTPNFTLSNTALTLTGSINATSGNFVGSVTANTGYIGGSSGWQIETGYITTSGIELLSGTSPAIKIGASGYSANGIWLGKDTSYKASFWNTSNARGLKWDGQKLIISASNFSLDTTGNISASNAILGGTIRADEGYLGGSSGWTITSTKITTSGMQLLGGTTPAIKIGNASAYDTGKGIFMSGSAGSAYLRIGNITTGNDPYLLWDNTNLTIKTSNFTLSNGIITANQAVISGNIQANTGYIGGSSGWVIDTNKITTSGIQLLASSTEPAIKIGNASAYNNGTGVFISASSNNAAYFRIGQVVSSTAKYFLWDGTNLSWQTPNFTMSNNGVMTITGSVNATSGNFAGSIAANTGSIGGWTINSGGISSVHSYGTVSITRSGASNLSLTDTYGNFTYSAANSNLYTSSVNKYLVTSASIVTNFNRYESGITISQANPNQGFGVQINHLFNSIVPLFVFTVSGLTVDKEYILQSRLQNLTVQGIGTPTLADHSSIYCWITETTDPFGVVGALWDSNPLWREGSTEFNNEFNNLVKQYRMTPTSETTYLWVGGTIAPVDLVFSKVAKFTFSGFRIDSFKQYTELSQKGLLVFNSPENYLQLSSENDYLTNSSKGSLGLLNVAELHVNGTSINDRINNPISVFNGGTGTNSFANHQFLWYDSESKMITSSGFSSSSGGSAPYSHPEYPGITLSGAHVISSISVNSAGTLVTASRALTAANINAATSSRTITGTGLLGGGGDLTANRTITHNIANGAYHLPINGSAGQLIMYSGTAGSGSWTSNIQTTGTASFASVTASAGIKVNEAYYINTTSILTTQTVVATLTFSGVSAGFFDYIVQKGGQYYRAASITACKDASNVIIYTEFGIVQTGSVPITMSVRGDTNKISLLVTNGDNCTCKVLARGM